MKINDKDVKKLIGTCNETNVSIARIEEQIDNIEEHLGVQNNRLGKHATKIGQMQLDINTLDTRMWVLLFVGGTAGGLIGSFITKLVI